MLYNDNQTRFLLVEYGEAAAGFYGGCAGRPAQLGWGARGSDVFYLFPKSAGRATVAAYPGYPPFRSFEDELLWIAAFDDFPQAVRAELSFTLVPSDSLGFPDAAPVSYALSSDGSMLGYSCFPSQRRKKTWKTLPQAMSCSALPNALTHGRHQ